MKRKILVLFAFLFVLGFSNYALAEPPIDEIGQYGSFEYAYKIDSWDGTGGTPEEDTGIFFGEGTYTYIHPDYPAGVDFTIYDVVYDPDQEVSYFSWSCTVPIHAVLVKNGGGDKVYYYPQGSMGDTGLFGNFKNGNLSAVSHVTFGWNTGNGGGSFEYYDYYLIHLDLSNGETAWGGDTAGAGKAWWFYYETAIGGVQYIYAGQHDIVGEVEIKDGYLYITLYAGYSLSDDPESVKIEGYDIGDLPTKRPPAGKFKLYKGTELTVYVAKN